MHHLFFIDVIPAGAGMTGRFLYRVGIVLLLFLLLSGSARAGEEAAGLPIPRFVSLKSDMTNLRTGPGVYQPPWPAEGTRVHR